MSSDGSFLGSSNPAMIPAAVVGEPLDPSQAPRLADLLQAALSGATDPESLFATIQLDEDFIWAVPVWGVSGSWSASTPHWA